MLWEFLEFIWPFGFVGGIAGLIGYFIFGDERNDNSWVWGGGILGVIVGLFMFFNDDNTSIKVTDKQIEHHEFENNTLTQEEVINAVLYEYGVGSTIKSYTIDKPTGYSQVSEIPNSNNRNKRSFLVGFNLTNNRIAYLKGIATKKDGKIKIKVDEVILE